MHPVILRKYLDRRKLKSYTKSMKTAISLPNIIFKEAELYANLTGKSRSQLYTEAITEYLARHAPDAITDAMNKVCDNIGIQYDHFNKKAADNLLKKESW